MKFTVSLKENRVFRRLYAKGKSAVAPTMVLYCRRNGRRQSRLGLTTGTKLGHAVVRNKVRRRLREIYRLHEDRFAPGYDIVVVARVRAVHSSYAVLERDFLRLAKKLQLFPSQEERSHEGCPALDDPVLPPVPLAAPSPCCRFIPTCSAYALEAVEKYGALKGAFLPCAASCAATPFIGRRASSMTPSPDGRATAIPGGQAAGTPSHLEALQ